MIIKIIIKADNPDNADNNDNNVMDGTLSSTFIEVYFKNCFKFRNFRLS